MPANPRVLDRFWAKVDIRNDDECWPWRSDVDTYGRFRILRGYKCIGAHVFSWILANQREVPEGLMILHSCDNKRCVNPGHLSPGSHSQNTREAVERGLLDMTKAWSAVKKLDRCKRDHELTDDNVYVTGSRRKCKPCFAMRAKRYREEARSRREDA